MKSLLRKALLVGLTMVSVDVLAAERWLNLNLITQEHSNWCWSASSVAILRWYAKTPSQCSVVNWAYGLNWACGNTTFAWNSTANTPNSLYGTSGSIQGILRAWGVNNYSADSYLNWTSVVAEINANRPFVMRYGWTSGGGHFIVGYGYSDTGGTRRIGYMNPWPGEGYTWVNHSWAVSASDHAWTHSLRMY